MAAEATFTYNGSNSLTAVCTGLIPSTVYDLISNDPDSSFATGTSDPDGNLTLNITDIGGMSAGDTFFADVERDSGDANPVACIIIKYGTAGGTDEGLTSAVWSYDGGTGGTGVLSLTFTSISGVHYELGAPTVSASTPTVTGDGGAKTLTISDIDTGTATSFLADLYDADSVNTPPIINYAVRLFNAGVSGGGFNGQATAAFTPYATTSDLFRILKIASPTGPQTTAAQGDIDTATIEINAEIDWADDHAAATVQQLELLKGVCIDRAADLWRHRESAPGILGVVDEAVPSTFGRYSWERYAQRLSPLKEQWGIA